MRTAHIFTAALVLALAACGDGGASNSASTGASDADRAGSTDQSSASQAPVDPGAAYPS